MNTYDFVHLVIRASDNQIAGRTKLQKTVYFVGVLTGVLETLGYRPHFYGPYSAEVAGAVQDLRSLNFLKQETAGMGSADARGFEVARYDYTLTQDGKQIADEKAEQFPEDWVKIQNAVERLKRADASDYIKLSIAAKAYLMLKGASAPPTHDELATMATKFGWKVSEQQLKEATDWLESLDLVMSVTAS